MSAGRTLHGSETVSEKLSLARLLAMLLRATLLRLDELIKNLIQTQTTFEIK
jgi:hypothetical protein